MAITDGIVARYQFTGNANDSSGNGYNMTVSGATLTTDKNSVSNQAYLFDGVNDRLSSSSFQQATGDFSISVWVQNSNYGSSNQAITDVDNTGEHFYLINFTNGLTALVSDGTNTTSMVTHGSAATGGNSTTALAAGWHHIVMIWNNSTQNLDMYIDNVAQTGASGSTNITNITSALWIGAITNPLYYWNGKIDEYILYNRTLSAAEVTELYNGYDDLGGGEVIKGSLFFGAGF